MPSTVMTHVAAMTLPLRHILLFAFPSAFLLMAHVRPCLGLSAREASFQRFQMCSASLPETVTVVAGSRLHCGIKCADQSACAGFSYHDSSVCNLHHGANLTTYSEEVCLADDDTEYVVHFMKVSTSSPSIECQNGGDVINNGQECRCYDGYVGDVCQRLMIDCSEGLASPHYASGMTGLYWAQPDQASQPVQLQCNSRVHQTLLVRWVGNVTFNETMANYVSGFGSAGLDYWVGLETLHLVTSNPLNYYLGVQVSNHSNDPFYQHYYFNFKVKGQAEGYAMTFNSHGAGGAPSTPMGDCLTPLKNLPFSTYDDDNDGNSSRNCAADYGGGWWYGPECSQCNLGGELRWHSLTRVPGSVSEVFWLPGMVPEDFSPTGVSMFLYRDI